MQQLDVHELGVSTSVVGFGCGGLGGRLSSDESLRLLQRAADGGLRHIDVARSYGYGYAEGVVGRLLHNRRDEFFVVSKAGILPQRQSAGRQLAVSAARRAVKAFPGLRAAASRRAGQTFTPSMRVVDLEESLLTSLRELRTDHLDVLMLHECRVVDLTDEVVAWAEKVVSDGRARAWGIATRPEEANQILETRTPFAINVFSTASSPNREVLAAKGPRLRVIHSSIGTDLAVVRNHLEKNDRRQFWESRLGESLGGPALVDVLLRAGRGRVPEGVVLVGTQKLEHVPALLAVGEATPDPAFAAEIQVLAAEALPGSDHRREAS